MNIEHRMEKTPFFSHFLGLSALAPICSNHIMFAHDLCHSQIESFKGFFKFLKDLPRNDGAKRLPQIFNFQYSIVNSGLPGLGYQIATS